MQSAYASANIALLNHLRSNDPRWLDAAVTLLNDALKEPHDMRTRTHARFLLGQSLVRRYNLTGNFSDLEWGLRYTLEAVEATPSDDRDRAKRLEFLGGSLLTAAERFSPHEAQDLVRGHLRFAISTLEECIRLTPDDHPGLAWRLSTLGLAFRHRFERQCEGADLDKAIDWFEKAAAVAITADPVQRAGIEGNLGATLLLRYKARGDHASLAAAVVALKRTASLSPSGSPHHSGHLQNLARVLALAGEEDVDVDAAFSAAGRAASSRPFGADLEFSVEAGERAEKLGRWEEAATAYAVAQRKRDALVRAQLTRRFQTRQLGEETDIALRLAYARARVGDPDGAMMALESGRATLLSEALLLSELDPDRVRAVGRPDLAVRLKQAANEARLLEVASLNPDAYLLLGGEGQVRRRLEQVISEIRCLPEFASTDTTTRDVRELVRTQPVVYVAAAPAGGLAIVIPSDPERDVALMFLPDLRADNLARRTREFRDAHDGMRSDWGQWLRVLDDTCAWLWPTVMGPLLQALTNGGTTQFSLVPCGWLGLLPLHAAWTRDDARPNGRRYALDDALISYTPNARTLATATVRAADRRLLDDVFVVDNPASLPDDEHRLKDTGFEVDEIRRLVPGARVLAGRDASKANVIEGLSTSTLAHFACHGQSTPAQPLQSSLLLANGEHLMVHDLLAWRLDRARLVVLAACETAAIGHHIPDECVGLASAMLQAGGAGVVASMWAVSDRSTALLMRAFYRHLLEDQMGPSAALREAQLWLRDATNQFLARAGGDALRMRSVTQSAAIPWESSQPYLHPYYWAAFTYAGA